MESKICCTCKLLKPVSSFSRNKRSKDGLKEYCKECAAVKSAKYRKSHKDAVLIRNRDWYQKSKQKAQEKTEKQRMLSPSKLCSVCGIEKPIDDFYKCGNGGFRNYCKKCANEKASMNHINHRDEHLKKKRQYNKDHKEDIDSYNHEYYKAHAQEIKNRVIEWSRRNPERAKENHVFSSQRRRFNKSDFTISQWIFCKEYFNYQCAYCGKPMRRPTQDHVVPAENGGKNTASNIVPSCGRCNSSKGKKSLEEWYPMQLFYSKEREQRITAYFETLKHANTERAV